MTTEQATVRRLTDQATPEDIAAAIDADGVVIVEDLLPPELIAALNTELDPVLNTMSAADGYKDDDYAKFWGLQTKRLMGLAEFSDAFVQIMQHETILGVSDIRMLPNAKDYVLSTGMAIQIGPGEPAQALHPDDSFWPPLMGPDAPDAITFMMIACTDFTEENGATRVIPGSHRWPLDSKPRAGKPIPELETVPAVMRAGSVCFLSGKTVHGGGANMTADTARRGVFMGYCLGYLRGEEAVPLAMTPERLRELPERVRYLLGWGSVGSRLNGGYPSGGWVYKMRDAISITECGQ
jgi:hypothetical protein